jgi:hypothetical protein
LLDKKITRNPGGLAHTSFHRGVSGGQEFWPGSISRSAKTGWIFGPKNTITNSTKTQIVAMDAGIVAAPGMAKTQISIVVQFDMSDHPWLMVKTSRELYSVFRLVSIFLLQ